VKRLGLDRTAFAFANALLGRPDLPAQRRLRAAPRRLSRACLTPSFQLSDGSAAGALRPELRALGTLVQDFAALKTRWSNRHLRRPVRPGDPQSGLRVLRNRAL